jgi:hypothetical protein
MGKGRVCAGRGVCVSRLCCRSWGERGGEEAGSREGERRGKERGEDKEEWGGEEVLRAGRRVKFVTLLLHLHRVGGGGNSRFFPEFL